MSCLFLFSSSCLYEGSCLYMIPRTNNWRKRRTNKTWSLLQTTGGKDEQIRHDPSYKQLEEGKDEQTRHDPSYKQLEVKTNKQDMIPPTNNWRKRRTNKTWPLLQITGGKDEQTRHDPSYKQLEVKTNKQDMIPPTNNSRKRRTNKTWSLLQTTGGIFSSSVCTRDHILFVRLFLPLFVRVIMSCVFIFSSSCLYEGSCLVCSSFPPVVCTLQTTGGKDE
jgi:hypothetical protein